MTFLSLNAGLVASLLFLALLLSWLARESALHRHALASIPLRIHVNGTRGKSSTTRLIAAGLHAGGKQTFAKLTGTEARVIHCDGAEHPLPRRGPASIRELIPIIREAARQKSDAIVIECMALRPDLQEFCEHRLIKSHITVLTNIFLDHQDVMGTSLADISAAIARTIPKNGILVTTPEVAETIAKSCASRMPGELVLVSQEEIKNVQKYCFPYEVWPENVALALKVCELAGIDVPIAVEGMMQASPDPGNTSLSTFRLHGKTVTFVNALAANDPASTLRQWHRYMKGNAASKVILLNVRRDRRLRTNQLALALSAIHKGPFWICGDSEYAARQLRNNGISQAMIYLVAQGASWTHFLFDHPDQELFIFAAGNTKGFEGLPCITSLSAS